MDTAAIENWARYQYGKLRGHTEYTRQAARCESMYMGGGEQWSDEDKAKMAEEHRPWYEFNEIMPAVNSALGYQIQNRMDIAYRPRGERGDDEVATILSKVAMQIADANKFHWNETQVFSDGLIEQRGYYDLRISFDSNIKGEIALAVLDPRDVIPDPDAKQYDPDNWADVTISRWLTLDEIQQIYGLKARDAAKESGDEGAFGAGDLDDDERNSFGGASRSMADAYQVDGQGHITHYRVIDRQRFVYERTDCLVLPETGDVLIVDKMTQDGVAQAMAEGAMRARRMRRRVKWVVSTYGKVLFDGMSPYEHLTVVPYFAYFRRGKTRGMVDNAIGPQEVLNKGVSQFVHIINSSANSGWMVEEKSLTNMDTSELEEVGAKSGLVVEYKKGATPPQKIQANQVPTGVDRLIDRATTALKDVTVPDAMRGIQSEQQSGVAIQSTQFASQQQLAVPLDNLAHTRQLLAVRMLKLIQRYYDSYRIFRITETDPRTGKEQQKTLEINKFDPQSGAYLWDVTVGDYDVVVSEQPMQITFQNSQFQQVMEMRKVGVQIPDAVALRYSNLSDKHELIDQVSNQQQPSDPVAEAKAGLIAAQTKLADAQATTKAVEAQYSAIQTAQVITQIPATAPLADGLLRSAGAVDHDAAPIVPEAPAGMPPQQAMPMEQNTNPLTPANPGVGMNTGIETQRPDGVR